MFLSGRNRADDGPCHATGSARSESSILNLVNSRKFDVDMLILSLKLTGIAPHQNKVFPKGLIIFTTINDF